MKQIAWIYIVLIGLTLAFGAVGIAILLFGPRPALVSKKLRFGAMIITFNTMLAGCYAAKDAKESVTCYTESDSSTSSDCDSDTGKNTGSLPGDTDVACYAAPLDAGTQDSETADRPTDTDNDTGTERATDDTDSDTGHGCYEPYNETDIECYDIPDEYPTDSDVPSTDTGETETDPLTDAGTGDVEQSDDAGVECYVFAL